MCAVRPAIIFPFFLSSASAFFLRYSPHFSNSKTQVIFHLCTFFIFAVRFVCFISCCYCCCRCHSSDLNLSLNASTSMAASATMSNTHTHASRFHMFTIQQYFLFGIHRNIQNGSPICHPFCAKHILYSRWKIEHVIVIKRLFLSFFHSLVFLWMKEKKKSKTCFIFYACSPLH